MKFFAKQTLLALSIGLGCSLAQAKEAWLCIQNDTSYGIIVDVTLKNGIVRQIIANKKSGTTAPLVAIAPVAAIKTIDGLYTDSTVKSYVYKAMTDKKKHFDVMTTNAGNKKSTVLEVKSVGGFTITSWDVQNVASDELDTVEAAVVNASDWDMEITYLFGTSHRMKEMHSKEANQSGSKLDPKKSVDVTMSSIAESFETITGMELLGKGSATDSTKLKIKADTKISTAQNAITFKKLTDSLSDDSIMTIIVHYAPRFGLTGSWNFEIASKDSKSALTTLKNTLEAKLKNIPTPPAPPKPGQVVPPKTTTTTTVKQKGDTDVPQHDPSTGLVGRVKPRVASTPIPTKKK